MILVHGLGANRTVNFPTLSPFLANHGFCVFALTYGTRPKVDPPGYQPVLPGVGAIGYSE